VNVTNDSIISYFCDMKLLVVEDEIKMAKSLKRGLEEKQYEVILAHDGLSALKATETTEFDLIITDVILPGINGIEFCRRFRRVNTQTPVIMLTALGMTSDKLTGFSSGSDDYLVKPFDFEELLARIKVLLNRVKGLRGTSSLYRYANLTLNPENKEVARDEQIIELTAKEFALLEYFIRNPDKIISKEEIAKKVWDVDFDTGTNFIEVYVSYLRNKIDKDFSPKLIHTRKGIGYIFREEA